MKDDIITNIEVKISLLLHKKNNLNRVKEITKQKTNQINNKKRMRLFLFENESSKSRFDC